MQKVLFTRKKVPLYKTGKLLLCVQMCVCVCAHVQKNLYTVHKATFVHEMFFPLLKWCQFPACLQWMNVVWCGARGQLCHSAFLFSNTIAPNLSFLPVVLQEIEWPDLTLPYFQIFFSSSRYLGENFLSISFKRK